MLLYGQYISSLAEALSAFDKKAKKLRRYLKQNPLKIGDLHPEQILMAPQKQYALPRERSELKEEQAAAAHQRELGPASLLQLFSGRSGHNLGPSGGDPPNPPCGRRGRTGC
jgi:hypothetical protein